MDLWTSCDKHYVSAICHPLCHLFGDADSWDVTLWVLGVFQGKRLIVTNIFRNEFCNLKS